MLDALMEATALPNLHPALVHFPIALTAVALLFDTLLFARRRWVSLDACGAFLWVLAAAGAGVTYLAGEQAAGEAGLLEATAEAALSRHADAALATLIALAVLGLFRAGLAWRDRNEDRAVGGALRTLGLLGALAVQGLVAYTGDLGGALVYRHGIAVSRPRAEASVLSMHRNAVARAQAATTPEYLEDGSLLWTPGAGDVSAVGEILEPLGAARVEVVPEATGSDGISFANSGRALLALPGAWEDARIEARIDVSEFAGTVGLGARVDVEGNGGLLRLATSGGATLVARRRGQEEILDAVERTLSAGEVTVALSVSGRHWKGFLDGQSVVHGHASLPAPGRMVLLLDGTGTLRIVSLRITPMDERTAAGAGPEKPAHQHPQAPADSQRALPETLSTPGAHGSPNEGRE